MKKNPVSYAFALLMVIFYMALAVMLISPIFDMTFSLTLRILAGIVFFLYALLRAYRILKK